MILTLQEAKIHLRVDEYMDEDDEAIQSLILAANSYIENATGKNWDIEPIEPLAKLTVKLLLSKWYDHEAGQEKKVDGLLTTLSMMGRK